jgi:hypothetical protein
MLSCFTVGRARKVRVDYCCRLFAIARANDNACQAIRLAPPLEMQQETVTAVSFWWTAVRLIVTDPVRVAKAAERDLYS